MSRRCSRRRTTSTVPEDADTVDADVEYKSASCRGVDIVAMVSYPVLGIPEMTFLQVGAVRGRVVIVL